MGKENPRGKISIDHATRRGAKYIDAARQAGHDSTAPSSRRDATRPGDGIATVSQLQHDRYVADLVRDGLDNHRSVSPAPSTETDNS
nr:hypothetical protein [Candidatus Levybacteria bacterium]